MVSTPHKNIPLIIRIQKIPGYKRILTCNLAGFGGPLFPDGRYRGPEKKGKEPLYGLCTKVSLFPLYRNNVNAARFSGDPSPGTRCGRIFIPGLNIAYYGLNIAYYGLNIAYYGLNIAYYGVKIVYNARLMQGM